MLKGSIVALVTPFDKNGNIDFNELKYLFDYHIQNGTDGIVVLGTTGESTTLTYEEEIEVVEFSVKYVNKRVPLIVGSGSNDTRIAIEKSIEYSRLGADYLLVITPYYNKTNKPGLIKHFELIADAASCPIIMYNVPSRTGMNMSVDVVEKLSKHPNIYGIKEASGNLEYIKEISKFVSNNFKIYSGNDDIIVEMMKLGASGVISVVNNIAPKQISRLCQLCLENKYEEAMVIQELLLDVINHLFIEVNPIPVKAALNYLGFNVGGYRLPLYEMEEDNKNKLFEVLDRKKEVMY